MPPVRRKPRSADVHVAPRAMPCPSLSVRASSPAPDAARRGHMPAIAVASTLTVAAVAISVPFLRLWPPSEDEGAMLTGAVKLLRGGIFYRDVAAYPTPGAWYLLAGAMRLGGESVMTARVLTLIAFALTVGLFYLIARRVLSPGLSLSYATALLAIKFWAWPAWSMYLYADVAFALASAGILAFLVGWERQRRVHFFVAGFLLGAAALCKQTVGAYPAFAGLAVLLLACGAAARRSQGWQRLCRVLAAPYSAGYSLRFLAALVAGGVMALAVPAVYFAIHGLFSEMLAATVVGPVSGYLPLSRVSYLEMLDWSHFRALSETALSPYRVPVLGVPVFGWTATDTATRLWGSWCEAYVRVMYLLVPVFLVVPAVLLARRIRNGARNGDAGTRPVVVPALALMAGLFASALPRADYYHVIDVAPAWVLAGFIGFALAAEMAQLGRWRRPIVSGVACATVAWFAVGALGMAALWRQSSYVLELPRCGRVKTTALHLGIDVVVSHVRRHTSPRTPLFVLGPEAYLYFLTDRYSPWPFAQLYPGQAGADDGAQLARLIERKRIPYIIRGKLSPSGLPHLASYAPALVTYVSRCYHQIDAPGGGGRWSLELAVLRRNDMRDKEWARGGAGGRS